MSFSFPYRFDAHGRTSTSAGDQRLRELIEQVLFTSPGERLHRASFGSGLTRLLFAANSPESANAAQALVQGALQQWLGDLIVVDSVEVFSDGSLLSVKLSYRARPSGERRTLELERSV
jgi:phage baseplate assembly protein W